MCFCVYTCLCVHIYMRVAAHSVVDQLGVSVYLPPLLCSGEVMVFMFVCVFEFVLGCMCVCVYVYVYVCVCVYLCL